MPSSSSHIAILGATGAVGVECLRILEQRRTPVGKLSLLASARSAGATLEFQGEPVVVHEVSPQSFAGVDVAFFAAGADVAKKLAPIAVAAGAVVIDKSSAFRADAEVPLVIPEVNAGEISASLPKRGIIAVPNCSTIMLLIALEPLRAAFGVQRVVVSTYQAASGAGAAAMQELETQSGDVLAGREAVPRIFKEPCAFNVFSHDSTMDPATGSNSEEAKFTIETRRIWGRPNVLINATCVRVPVMRGHSQSICLTLERPATEAQVREAFRGGAAITITDDRARESFPTPLRAMGTDTVHVGRIRHDPTQPMTPTGAAYGWNLFLSADQLRLGAALTAVKIAELLPRR